MSDNELRHHGVKGMKWGVRKKQASTSDLRRRYDSTKSDYKRAKKEYDKSFDNAYSRSVAAYSPIKKHRQANDDRWEDAIDKAYKANAAQTAYKQAKKERKAAIKSTYKQIQDETSIGEKLLYNRATRRKAAKYVVDNDMSVADANKKAKGDAWRNSAAFVGIYGAVTVGSIIASKRL